MNVRSTQINRKYNKHTLLFQYFGDFVFSSAFSFICSWPWFHFVSIDWTEILLRFQRTNRKGECFRHPIQRFSLFTKSHVLVVASMFKKSTATLGRWALFAQEASIAWGLSTVDQWQTGRFSKRFHQFSLLLGDLPNNLFNPFPVLGAHRHSKISWSIFNVKIYQILCSPPMGDGIWGYDQ